MTNTTLDTVEIQPMERQIIEALSLIEMGYARMSGQDIHEIIYGVDSDYPATTLEFESALETLLDKELVDMIHGNGVTFTLTPAGRSCIDGLALS